VVANHFTSDKGEQLLGKVWVEFADRREMPQPADLLGFSSGVARGQPMLCLQFADGCCQTVALEDLDLFEVLC
jgi:hypothetical protein